MKLSMIRKMAADAVDRQESGDETAAGEMHAFCVANLDEVLDALGSDGEPEIRARLSATIRDYPLDDFPKALLKTCDTHRVKEHAREATRLAKQTAILAAASAVGASVALDGVAYTFDKAALVALVKAARPNDWIYFGIDGYHLCLRIPARSLKDLHKVHPLDKCDVEMTCPSLVPDRWQFTVRWSERGGYRVSLSQEHNRRDARDDHDIHVTLPSLTTMVSRELGVEAA